MLFAFSTMISWSYYGEQCWAHLFGVRSILAYKLHLPALRRGAAPIFAANAVIDVRRHAMILGMAFPNLIGVVLLSGMHQARTWIRLHRRGCAPASSVRYASRHRAADAPATTRSRDE